ncbi:MAG: PspC domain-containing protein [Candidatus Kerfeldbacteria bacterium]|nr:PspC domain-containing protein [Candidatus Kerfeldbacteria bacterium]
MTQQPKRLYRSRSERVIAGVAGGLGHYFGIDPTLVRIAFIVLTFLWGGGLFAYLALWVIVPLEGKAEVEPSLGKRVRLATDEAKAAAKKFKDDVTKR